MMFREMSLDRRFQETKVYGIWESTVGEAVAKRTQNLRVQNGTLYVSVDSSVLRSELQYAKYRLIRLLNSKMRSDAIKDIVFH